MIGAERTGEDGWRDKMPNFDRVSINTGAYRKAKNRVSLGKLGVYPILRTKFVGGNPNKPSYRLGFVLMHRHIRKFQKACKDFDIPIFMINRHKYDKYGYYHVLLVGWRALQWKQVMEGATSKGGKVWKKY